MPTPPRLPTRVPVLFKLPIVPLLLVPTPTLVVPEIWPALVNVLPLIVPEGVRLPTNTPVPPSIMPVLVFCKERI
ncbi:hypothetical protein D3C80_1727190 [compost metagenome]